MKDTERFRGGCWAELNGQMGISLRSFPDAVLDIDKAHVCAEALRLKETFYEQEFTMKIYSSDDEEGEDLPPEDEGEGEYENNPSLKEDKCESVTHTRLVSHMQSLTFRPVELSEAQIPIMSALINIAQATDKLITAEVTVESDEYCEHLRKDLNRCYDNFVESYGKIHEYYSWFGDRNSFWVDYRLVQYALCLENEAGQKVDLFYRRQTRPRTIPTGQIFFDEKEGDRIVKAFWWCRSYFNNQVDLEQIAEKSGSNAEIVEDTLLAMELVDRIPVGGAADVVEVVESQNENVEATRLTLEKAWNQMLEVPTEKTYSVSVTRYGKISQVEVTGYVGKLGFLAVTKKNENGRTPERFPLVHLATGMKIYEFASLSTAIECMNRLECVGSLKSFFQETDGSKFESEYIEEKESVTLHIREYIHTPRSSN